MSFDKCPRCGESGKAKAEIDYFRCMNENCPVGTYSGVSQRTVTQKLWKPKGRSFKLTPAFGGTALDILDDGKPVCTPVLFNHTDELRKLRDTINSYLGDQ